MEAMSRFTQLDHTGFPHHLKLMRERRKRTRRELSGVTGISVSLISNFENGHRYPSLANFCRLCNALDCHPEALL